MKHVLVTGFEPFGGKKTNISEQALAGLQDMENIQTAVLPVEFGRAGLEAAALTNDGGFDAVLLLGERPSFHPTIGFEQRAHNQAYAGVIADNAGQRRLFSKIAHDGPSMLPATMDYGPLEAALEHEPLRVRQQRKIGRFVCNDLFYSVLHAQASGDISPDVEIGFAHLGTGTDAATARHAIRRAAETLRGDTLGT